MSKADRWDVIWAKCFENQPEGHAIYRMISTNDMKPGMCGYFDEYGQWQPLVDLTKPDELVAKGYGVVEGDIAYRNNDKGEKWPTRMTSNMKRFDPNVTVGLEAPALPVGGSLTIGFKTSSGNGAIQLTDGDVKYRQAYPPILLSEWLVKNGQKLVQKNPDTKGKKIWNSGKTIWIVTQTYDVKHRALALLTSKEAEVTLSVSAQAERMGKVEATTNWMKSQKTGLWNDHELEEGVVIAMNGISWKDTWYHSSVRTVTNREDQQLLGGVGDEETVVHPIDFEIKVQGDSGEESYTVELMPEIKPNTVPGVKV